MKTIVAVLATAAICAGGARAYDAAVTPARVAALEARVAALESFDRNCLRRYRVHLSENSQGVMTWGLGAVTPHGANFYAIPDTASRIPLACL